MRGKERKEDEMEEEKEKKNALKQETKKALVGLLSPPL
jgi:hypothetical protein